MKVKEPIDKLFKCDACNVVTDTPYNQAADVHLCRYCYETLGVRLQVISGSNPVIHVLNCDGIVLFRHYLTDVSNRKKTQENLEDAETNLKRLWEVLAEGIMPRFQTYPIPIIYTKCNEAVKKRDIKELEKILAVGKRD